MTTKEIKSEMYSLVLKEGDVLEGSYSLLNELYKKIGTKDIIFKENERIGAICISSFFAPVDGKIIGVKVLDGKTAIYQFQSNEESIIYDVLISDFCSLAHTMFEVITALSSYCKED